LFPSLAHFCTRLAATPVSQYIQSTEWLIPTVQTIHILAVAAVMTAILVIDLRLLGLKGRDISIGHAARRFFPAIWCALPLLLLTGAALIVAEPSRSLRNPVFVLKMALLATACGVTLLCQIVLRRDPDYFERSAGHRWLARLLAGVSLPLWVGIVCAGRWIAYVQSS
jgi:hypothetical protein